MFIKNIRGLVYPDEFITKFFFKNKLNENPGKVLELGCGNGNNLMLFRHYGWNVIGIDISPEVIRDAEENFALLSVSGGLEKFIRHDLTLGIGEQAQKYGEGIDVLLIPNSLYYLPRDKARETLFEAGKLLNPGALIYLRNRTKRDYRYRRGVEVERNGFILAGGETGEKGALNVFYDEWECIDLMREALQLDHKSVEVLHIDYESMQNGIKIPNSDVCIWGISNPHS
jgi:SAM-dependent methyltransferase